MNEAQTRLNKIDPKLRDAGWSIVPGSKILVEQSAYIAPGRITTTGNKNLKKADYILEYKGIKLAVIEAKSDEKDVSEGVGQAKEYADALKIRYTYSSNGDEIWFIDMGVKNHKGEYIIPSKEQREFDNLILQYYVSNGFKELGADNLKTFITIKFNSMSDAKERLNMSVADMREHYFELQRRLYSA